MQTLQPIGHSAALLADPPQRATVFVDCADPARQDVFFYWLERSGYHVHDGPPPAQDGSLDDDRAGVLLTDRFGPGLDSGVTILQRKEQRPGLHVIVVGCGDASEPAQLSLARAAGADATLSARVDREALVGLLRSWT